MIKLFRNERINRDEFVKVLKKDVHSTWHEVKNNRFVKADKQKEYKEGFIDGLAYCLGAINHYCEEFKEAKHD